ncbi:hypothetical protein ACQPX6_17550 [Actinomycetospora sp. CA-101289]|uniref:hypothetical protein n=1 Tax=Actinomycetospora sp. CA-101289 TaxID=3239893 RepID=UPI003D95E338
MTLSEPRHPSGQPEPQPVGQTFPWVRGLLAARRERHPLLRAGPRKGPYRHELEALARQRLQHGPDWTAAAEGSGLTRTVIVAAGETAVIPRLIAVAEDDHGRPLSLIVELLPGQLPGDYLAVADRLALALDAAAVRFDALGGRFLRITLLDDDPLGVAFDLPRVPISTSGDAVILGRDEAGRIVGHVIARAAHIAVQGQNGSGKSAFLYGLLAQLAEAPDVLVAGCDPTGLLLGAPWDGTRHRDWQCAAGAGRADLHAAHLESLVAEMDRRLADMPPRVDTLTPSPDLPLIVVVLEEYPGLLRAAAAQPAPAKINGKAPPTVLQRIKLATLRLLSESRKVAFRVIMLAQRAEAESMGGGYARDQFALSISFRVPADSLVMLHGDDARPWGSEHQIAPPGIALVTAPGRPLTRLRVPWSGGYADYCARISGPQ